MNYRNRVLRYIGDGGLLNKGESVYCFVDEGHRFIVQTKRDIFGVNQIIFKDSARKNFIIEE